MKNYRRLGNSNILYKLFFVGTLKDKLRIVQTTKNNNNKSLIAYYITVLGAIYYLIYL